MAERARKFLYREISVSKNQPIDAEYNWNSIPKKYFRLYRRMPRCMRCGEAPHTASHTTTPRKPAMDVSDMTSIIFLTISLSSSVRPSRLAASFLSRIDLHFDRLTPSAFTVSKGPSWRSLSLERVAVLCHAVDRKADYDLSIEKLI